MRMSAQQAMCAVLWLPVVVSLAGGVPYCTDAGTGTFKLRNGSRTKALLETTHINKHSIYNSIIDRADASEYAYAYDERNVVGRDGAVAPRCVAPEFDRERARRCLRGKRLYFVGNSVTRGTAFALRELLVHGSHAGASGNGSGWSFLPPREKQMEMCPKEDNLETNLAKHFYSCRMLIPDLNASIVFSWSGKLFQIPPKLMELRPEEYDVVVAGMSIFMAMELNGKAEGGVARGSIYGSHGRIPTSLAAAARRLLGSREPPRVVFAGPTAMFNAISTDVRRSDMNDELGQVAGLYRDALTTALAEQLPRASLAERDGAADVSYWDNWAITDAGAEMAGVARLRSNPKGFIYEEIKPAFKGEPRYVRRYNQDWNKGGEGWFDDAIHPSANLQMHMVDALLAHLCPHGDFAPAQGIPAE